MEWKNTLTFFAAGAEETMGGRETGAAGRWQGGQARSKGRAGDIVTSEKTGFNLLMEAVSSSGPI